MKKFILIIMLISFSCSRAPKPKTETVVEYETSEDYFIEASERQWEYENKKQENEQKRYDIINAVTVAIITLMLVQY